MTLGYSTVRLNVTALVIDGADADDLPDDVALSGTITLSPMIQTGRTIQYDEGGRLKLKALTEMEADIGAAGDISHRNRNYVKVVAPTAATTNMEELQYKATFKNLKTQIVAGAIGAAKLDLGLGLLASRDRQKLVPMYVI